MRYSRWVLSCSFLPFCLGTLSIASMAQTGAATPAVKAASQLSEKETVLPVRQVSLYKNGVGFFEQAGKVNGNELVRLDVTTAQLNDVLQSLTAVDLGDGRVMGAGYNSATPLALQLNQLAPGLGQDPTVMDFLHALKGKRVEVHSAGGVFAGRLLNVEVRMQPEDKGSVVLVERRYVSVIGDAGGLRTFELTPSVEVRLVGGDQQEIGRYLSLLAGSHEPSLRHLTLEDRGTGERELHISYLSAVPAWKSSYRILFSNGKESSVSTGQTATLQGWAVVDNTSGADWKDVQLTLISGAPQSFIQQISRPLDVRRPDVSLPMPGLSSKTPIGRSYGVMGAMADPIGAGEAESVPMSASSIGGGSGVEVHRAQTATQLAASAAQAEQQRLQPVSLVGNYERAAGKTLAPETTSVGMDDLFEYKLSKPITIRKSESATVPILQTEVKAERVTVWSPHDELGTHADRPMRALWLTNSSDLTLDRGSFSVLEDGVFGGEGQMDLLHPTQRQIVPYAADEAVTVDFKEPRAPAYTVQHVAAKDGMLSVHRLYPKVRTYTIHNAAASARMVVLEPARTNRFQMEPGRPKIAAGWDLASGMPAPAETTDTIYRFEVPVAANATSEFKLVEVHSHPVHYELASMHEDEMKAVLKEVAANPEAVAKLQPILDAMQRRTDLFNRLKVDQKAMAGVEIEEKRIRSNMAALNGGDGHGLAKLYADEMKEQEDKLASLHMEVETLTAQHDAAQKDVAVIANGLEMDSHWPKTVEKASLQQ